MPYLVRDAIDTEVFRLVEISQQVLAESPTYTHMAFDKEKSANYLYGAIMKQPGWFLRVISEIESNEIVGGLVALTEVSIFGPDKIAYDITVMVDKAHRGRCLKQLVQVIEEYKTWATTEGAKVIKIGVSSGLNIDSASAFLEKLGFARIGAMHGYVLGSVT